MYEYVNRTKAARHRRHSLLKSDAEKSPALHVTFVIYDIFLLSLWYSIRSGRGQSAYKEGLVDYQISAKDDEFSADVVATRYQVVDFCYRLGKGNRSLAKHSVTHGKT